MFIWRRNLFQNEINSGYSIIFSWIALDRFGVVGPAGWPSIINLSEIVTVDRWNYTLYKACQQMYVLAAVRSFWYTAWVGCGLGLIRRGGSVLSTQAYGDCNKELWCKLWSIVGQLICQNSIQDDQIVHKDGRGSRPRYCWAWYAPGQFLVSVCQDNVMLIAGFCPEKQKFPSPQIWVGQQLETDVIVSDGGLSSLMQRVVYSWLLLYMHWYPYVANWIHNTVYRQVACHLY